MDQRLVSLKDWDVYRYCKMSYNIPEHRLDTIFENELYRFYMHNFGKLPVNRNNNSYIKMSDADCVTFFHMVNARLAKHQLVSKICRTITSLLYLAVVVIILYIFCN